MGSKSNQIFKKLLPFKVLKQKRIKMVKINQNSHQKHNYSLFKKYITAYNNHNLHHYKNTHKNMKKT